MKRAHVTFAQHWRPTSEKYVKGDRKMRKSVASRALLAIVCLSLVALPCFSSGSIWTNYVVCGNPGYADIAWSTSGEPDPVDVWVSADGGGQQLFAGAQSGDAGAPWIYFG